MIKNLIAWAKNFSAEHPHWTTIIILSLMIAIFISPGFFQGRYLAPVNIYQFIAPYLDITTQMLPWYKLSGDLIQHGHFPLWNIYSGFGLPLFANMQSSVLFPLTWLFYIFNIKLALLAYAYLKLLLAGFFTYLYLREIKLRYVISLIGGVLFMFSGINAIWFLWPLTSVLLILPLCFWLIEKYFNSNKVIFAFLLSPAIALGIFAGHPQTFFYAFCAIAGYTAFKAFTTQANFKQSINKLFMISVFYGIGFLMAAVVLIPFVEYLTLSANIDYRAGFTENPFYLAKHLFLANIIPDFYGNPGVRNFSYLLVPNYGEMALGYVGISALVIALFAWGKERRKQTSFFVVAALLSAGLIYHFPIFYQLVNKLPGFNLNYNNRLLYLWAFFVIVLACFGLEKLLNNSISRLRFRLTWLGFAVFSAALIIYNRYLTKSWEFANNLDWNTVNLWQTVLICAFIANVLVSFIVTSRLPRRIALVCFVILIFIETGLHGMIFLRTSTPENFYPPEPAIEYLKTQQTDLYRTYTYGDLFLPNIGTWYGVNQLNDHDTIYLRSNKLLKQSIAKYNYSPEYTFEEPNLNALRFFGVKYLLYPHVEGQRMLQKYPEDLSVGFDNDIYTVLTLNKVFPRAFLLNAANSDEVQKQISELLQNPQSHPITEVREFSQNMNGDQTVVYESAKKTYLVTTDNYYPDWIAELPGGEKLTIENISGLRAVALPADQKTVTISYHPKSLQRGAIISLATVVLWLGALKTTQTITRKRKWN